MYVLMLAVAFSAVLVTSSESNLQQLNTVEETEKFLADFEHSIVGFFSSPDTLLAKEFAKVSESVGKDFRLATTTNADVLTKYGRKDQIVIYQPPRLQGKLEPAEVSYAGSTDKELIKTFIETKIDGIVGHRTKGNAKRFKNPLVVVYYNVDYVKDEKGSNYVRNRIIQVAQKLKTEGLKINFAVSNAQEFESDITDGGLTFSNDKVFVLGYGVKDERYSFTGKYSPESLEKFARDLLAGSLKAHLKSQPVPASNNNPVKTVVAKNFEKIVNDPTKDVLIEFYSPNCGACRRFELDYEELAETLEKEKDIVIARIDVTANDVPPLFETKRLPSIYLAPKKSKKSPKKFNGPPDVEDLIEFLDRESSASLKKYIDATPKDMKDKYDPRDKRGPRDKPDPRDKHRRRKERERRRRQRERSDL